MSIDFDYPLAAEISRNVAAALAEDVGPGDLTASLVPGDRRVRATVISREDGVLCGTAWFDEVVRRCDPTATVTWHGADGDRIAANQLLCEIEGNGRALRAWLRQLGLYNGLLLKFEKLGPDEWLQASVAAYVGDLQPMEKLLARITEPVE